MLYAYNTLQSSLDTLDTLNKNTVGYIPSFNDLNGGVKVACDVIAVTINRECVFDKGELLVLKPLEVYRNLRRLRIVGMQDRPSFVVGFECLPQLDTLELVNCQIHSRDISDNKAADKVLLENTDLVEIHEVKKPEPMSAIDKFICLSSLIIFLAYIGNFVSSETGAIAFHLIEILRLTTDLVFRSVIGFNLHSVQSVFVFFCKLYGEYVKYRKRVI